MSRRRISWPRGRLTRTDRAYRPRPWQRLGGSPRSSTRSIPDRSRTPAGTASATSRGSPAGSTTSSGSEWMPCGCPRSSGPPWPTSATTSLTTATSTPCSGRSPTSTTSSPRSTDGGCDCCSTSCRTTPRPSTRGSSRAARLEQTRSAPGTCGATPQPEADPPTTGELRSPEDPRGHSTRQPASTTSTCFLPEQPDLDWSNPEVEEAMHEVVRFWLDRGIDGFRIDVVHLIGKDPALADHPPERAQWPHVVLNDHDSTHVLLRRLRRLVDSYSGDRVTVGEVVLSTAPRGDLLRQQRRAAPRIQLSAPARRVDRGPVATPRSSARTSYSTPATRGRRGCSETTTSRGFAPGTEVTRVLGLPPCCCSRCGARRSSTPATSSVSKTPRCAARRCSIPEDATDVARRSPGIREPPHGWDGATPWLPFPPHAGREVRGGAARRSLVDALAAPRHARPSTCIRGAPVRVVHVARRARRRARLRAHRRRRSVHRVRELRVRAARRGRCTGRSWCRAWRVGRARSSTGTCYPMRLSSSPLDSGASGVPVNPKRGSSSNPPAPSNASAASPSTRRRI